MCGVNNIIVNALIASDDTSKSKVNSSVMLKYVEMFVMQLIVPIRIMHKVVALNIRSALVFDMLNKRHLPFQGAKITLAIALAKVI